MGIGEQNFRESVDFLSENIISRLLYASFNFRDYRFFGNYDKLHFLARGGFTLYQLNDQSDFIR